MFTVYILESVVNKRYYIGHTANLEKRIATHNSGDVRSTKAFKPWIVIYQENTKSKSEAYKRELQIKSYKSGEAFKNLITRRSG